MLNMARTKLLDNPIYKIESFKSPMYMEKVVLDKDFSIISKKKKDDLE